MLARGSALRFMLTRLYDWLTVPDGGLVMKRDPTEYIRQMRMAGYDGDIGDFIALRSARNGHRPAPVLPPLPPAPPRTPG